MREARVVLRMRYAFSARHPVTRITIVGFLDDLKRQAEAIKTQQTVDVAALARNTALADAACKSVLQYWMELAACVSEVRPRHQDQQGLSARDRTAGVEIAPGRHHGRRDHRARPEQRPARRSALRVHGRRGADAALAA